MKIKGLKGIAAALCLLSGGVLANDCKVMVSQSTIHLGTQRFFPQADALFPAREVTVSAECGNAENLQVVVDGIAGEHGRHFRFGGHGQMQLSVISAQLNGVATDLLLTSVQRGEQRLSGQSHLFLSAGDRLKPVALPRARGSEKQHLVMQLRMTFPFPDNHPVIREAEQFESHVIFSI